MYKCKIIFVSPRISDLLVFSFQGKLLDKYFDRFDENCNRRYFAEEKDIFNDLMNQQLANLLVNRDESRPFAKWIRENHPNLQIGNETEFDDLNIETVIRASSNAV